MRSSVKILLVLVLCLSQMGCSWVFVQPTSDDVPCECTDSRIAPHLDMTMGGITAIPATIGIVGPGVAYVMDDNDGPPKEQILGVGLLFAAIAATYFTSGSYGYDQSKACRLAHRHHRCKTP